MSIYDFKLVRKKTSLFVLLILQGISFGLYSACPCNNTGCTFTSAAGNDPASYVINAGQKLCIPAGSTVTGSITLNGGTISNQGTFSASTFTFSGGTFDNCGSFTINLTIPAACVFNNCSNGIITNGSITMGNTGSFTNYGIVNITGSSNGNFTIGNSATFNNYGILCVSRDFICGNASTQNNYGVINTYNFINGNMSAFYNGCMVDVSHDFTVGNSCSITGPTSGTVYGRFNVAGTSNLLSGSVFGSGTEQLDMCDAGSPPGGFDAKSGSVGSSVTYCTNSGCTVIGSCCTIPTPAITGTSTVCSGSGTTLSVSGGSSYSWNTGATTSAITVSPVVATTYTVTVSNGGCSSSATRVVNVNSSPTAGITGGSPVCNGNSATLTGAGGGTYAWSTGETTTSITVTPVVTSTYTVIVTDASACTAKATRVLTINSNPTSSITSQSNVACTGSASGSATVTGSGGTPTYTYLWNNGKTTADVIGLTAGTYSVTITDNNGCTKQQTVIITQPASAVNAVASVTDATCGSSNGTAAVTASGGTPSYTYLWSNGQTTATVSSLSAGSYNVTVTDNNGCTKNASVSVNNLSGPTVGITSQTNVLCSGIASGSVTVTASGTGPLTYNWNNGVTSTTGTASSLTAGTYIVTVTDGNGCVQGQTVNITQPASALGSSISSQVNVGCIGDATGSVTVTGTGGTPAHTYLWNTGQTSAGINGLTSGSYNVIVKDANGCTTQQTVSITQPTSALASAISSQSNVNCTGSATGSATVTGTGGTPAYTYSWNNGQTDAAITGLASGTYTVMITDANGCSVQQTVAITQPASGLGFLINSQNDADCNGSATGSATVTGTGGTPAYSYNWNTGATTADVTGLIAGTYSVTITDNNGCTKEQTVVITQPSSPLSPVILSQKNAGCTGSATGSASVTGNGGSPAYTYSWSPGGQITNSVSGLSSGSYTVTITDSKGCTINQTVAITQPASGMNMVVDSTNSTCRNANGIASVIVSGGTPGYSYNWSSGGTNSTETGLAAGSYIVTVTDANGCLKSVGVSVNSSPGPVLTVSSSTNVTCNGLNNGSATLTTSNGMPPYSYGWNPNVSTNNTVNGLSANTYTVVVSDTSGCTDTVQFTITEPLPITFTVSSFPTVVCAGETVLLTTGTPSGGIPPFTFTWLPNGPLVNPIVPTTYTVVATDSGGCVSAGDTLLVIPLLSPTAGFDTLSSGMFHQKYNLLDKSVNGTNWFWDFGDGSSSNLQNPFHEYNGAGTYTVTQIVTNTSGCTDTITKVIIVLPKIIIPNVFTPNNDGVNDEFWIPSSGFESFELTIYDRWGLKLFVTDQGEIRWDGRTSAGEEVPDGTYYFLLNAVLKTETKGKIYEAKGFIDLHRGGRN